MHDHHDHDHDHDRKDHGHHDDSHDSHGHSHGLIDESILRSKDGVRAVAVSLVVLLIAALLQAIIFFATNSVSLLADLVHNSGDALTAIPLAAAFMLRSKVAEKYAGYFVVATIFVSACFAGREAIVRFFHPQPIANVLILVAGGLIGFIGNLIVARIRMNAGKRLHSPALIADGAHARVDAYVSLSVVASAILVALGLQVADPFIGLLMTVVILRITWHSYRTIRAA